jgi:large subunit ribosomal protein L25
MEKTLLLKAEVREHTGSKYAAKLRKQGRIPAIVYGHRKEPVAISLDEHHLVEGLHHGIRIIDVQIGNSIEKTIVKDLQFDYLGKDVVHLDLLIVDVAEMIKLMVPIEFKGAAKGALEGGIIETHADSLEIECKLTDIPDAIVVSVKEMNVGDSLHASDIALPDGVKLVSLPSTLVVTCGLVAAAKSTEELEEEAPAAPEVIGEAKETEEESSKEAE